MYCLPEESSSSRMLLKLRLDCYVCSKFAMLYIRKYVNTLPSDELLNAGRGGWVVPGWVSWKWHSLDICNQISYLSHKSNSLEGAHRVPP
jgi:hypothetical protein